MKTKFLNIVPEAFAALIAVISGFLTYLLCDGNLHMLKSVSPIIALVSGLAVFFAVYACISHIQTVLSKSVLHTLTERNDT